MPTWPATLPQTPLIEGFSDEPQDSVLRSQMTGLNKQRNRYTAALHDVSESYLLTPSQFDTFVSFYKDDLGNGAADFSKKNPINGLTETYRFSGVYNFSYNGVHYKVKLPLERKP